MDIRVPMANADIDEVDVERVAAVVASGRLSLGPALVDFENAFAEFLGRKHAVAVSSGTAGLHVGFLASGIGPGDFVITSPFSFIASANSVLHAGATPLFVDVEESDGNMDAKATEGLISKIQNGEKVLRRWDDAIDIEKVKALLPVHVWGEPIDVEAMAKVADDNSLPVIEDACEALGATYRGQLVGTFGRLAVFGFYPNKQMTTGEGGMIVTDDDELADVCRSLRNQGRDTTDEWLSYSRLGYNFRMDEMSAALGLSQLQKFDRLLDRRQRVADWYGERLGELSPITLFNAGPNTTRKSWFVYPVQLGGDLDRDDVIRELRDRGIPSRPYFPAIHLENYYARRFGYRPGDYPVAERLGATCVALPFSGVMTEEQVEVVVEALLEVLAQLVQ
ncbi:MAG: perosamine synthetase [Actinomycetota bacterium]|nr:perosamine synthetase [Actinomycetota bacterium]